MNKNNIDLEQLGEWLSAYNKTDKDIQRDLAGDFIFLDGMTVGTVDKDGVITSNKKKIYLPTHLQS